MLNNILMVELCISSWSIHWTSLIINLSVFIYYQLLFLTSKTKHIFNMLSIRESHETRVRLACMRIASLYPTTSKLIICACRIRFASCISYFQINNSHYLIKWDETYWLTGENTILYDAKLFYFCTLEKAKLKYY